VEAASDRVAGPGDAHVVLGVRAEGVYDATDWCNPELVTRPATVAGIEHTGREAR
jgi:hypothetical protein